MANKNGQQNLLDWIIFNNSLYSPINITLSAHMHYHAHYKHMKKCVNASIVLGT